MWGIPISASANRSKQKPRRNAHLIAAPGARCEDAYFDYDHNDLRADAVQTLTEDAAALRGILRDFPTASVAIEGHSDERGSAEYNLGLGTGARRRRRSFSRSRAFHWTGCA